MSKQTLEFALIGLAIGMSSGIQPRGLLGKIVWSIVLYIIVVCVIIFVK